MDVPDDGRACPTRVSVARTAPALGRPAGSFVNRRAMIGASGPERSWARGASWTTAVAVARAVPSRNGGSPSTMKYSSAPSAHRSVAGVMSPPVACSGAMYDGEPTMRPVFVTRDSSRMVATPKSVSLALSSWSTRTLAGFTSRWTTPARCAASSAVSTCRPRRAARSWGSGPSSATSWARLGPSTSSMTSQMAPDSSTTSYTATVAGLFSRAEACASRRARARTASASSCPASSSTRLMATRRRRRVSVATYTVDRPWPRGSPSS